MFLVDWQSLMVWVHLYSRRQSEVHQGRSRIDNFTQMKTRTSLLAYIDKMITTLRLTDSVNSVEQRVHTFSLNMFSVLA